MPAWREQSRSRPSRATARAGDPSRSAANTGSISAKRARASWSPPRTRFSAAAARRSRLFEIGEYQLDLDRLGIADRIDRALAVPTTM
jgi:hypothetical protein